MKKITISPLASWTPELTELVEKEKAKIPFLEMKEVIELDPLIPLTRVEKYGIDNIVKSILLVKIMIDLIYTIVGVTAIKSLISNFRKHRKVTMAMITTIAGLLFSIRSIIKHFSALKDAMFTLWDIKGAIMQEILDLSGDEWEQIKKEIVLIFKA